MYKNLVCSAKRKKVQTLDSCFRAFGPYQQEDLATLILQFETIQKKF